jgi:hypothetical protein
MSYGSIRFDMHLALQRNHMTSHASKKLRGFGRIAGLASFLK